LISLQYRIAQCAATLNRATWVVHHKLTEIGMLAAQQKLIMLKTLAAGWIAEEDVAGMVRICLSVRDRQEAKLIREAFDGATP
jgi:hypothetical protein